MMKVIFQGHKPHVQIGRANRLNPDNDFPKSSGTLRDQPDVPGNGRFWLGQ